MSQRKAKTKIINGLLQFLLAGSLLTTAVLAPNALVALDKPLKKYFAKKDKKTREYEYQQLLRYMKHKGLIEHNGHGYEHGIQLTEKGKKRAEKANLDQIVIPKPHKWDKKWRIVFFDVPETNKTARDYFSHKIKDIGMVQLQKSVWIHPFPCLEEVSAIARRYGIEKHVTYIETSYISSSEKLCSRFSFKF